MGLMKYEKHKALSFVIVLVISLLIAVCAERIYPNIYGLLRNNPEVMRALPVFSLMYFYRVAIFAFLMLFLLIHFIVDIKVFYNAVFKFRYVLAVSFFLILVAGQIHFSSIGMYDNHIQPGLGSEFTNPVFGFPRAIRSDEWVVTTPTQLSAQFSPDAFGRYNYVARGAATENMPNGMTFNLATLAFPFSIFYLFGAGYGVSARWVGTLILTFMVTFEFAHIISGKNRLLALAGACLITFSPFFQWWSYVVFITSGMGALVCFYYFINSATRVRRILFSLGIVVFLSQFIVNLYPAWQVPAGYLYFGLVIWIVVDNWEKVKKLDKLDYGILSLMLVLIAAVVGTYLHESREYISGISNTVYPGARFISGGGGGSYTLNRMMNGGVFAPISAFRSFAYTNICEFGGMYTLFPVPVLFLAFLMIKKRTFDLLSIILVVFTLFVGTYVFIGFPDWLAGITLMSFSSTSRAMDVMLFAQVFLLIRAMKGIFAPAEPSSDKISIYPLIGAVGVGICLTVVSMFFNRTTFANPIPLLYFAVSFIGFVLVAYCVFSSVRNSRVYVTACIYLVAMSTLTLMTIHPVMRGLDAIYSKPLSVKVSELAENPDEKWISLDGVTGPAFLIASGASTINSTNFYPNLDLWYKLDPNREYEYIYNRYANIVVALTAEATSFGLLHADSFLLNLSYNDLAIAGVKYIHTSHPLENPEALGFTLLYNEGDALIYSVD